MPRLRARRALIAVAVAVAVALGLAAARAAALRAVERAMEGRGISWSKREDGLVEARWTEIAGPGLSAASVEARLLPATRVAIRGLDLDLSAARADPGGDGGAASPLPRLPALLRERVAVEIEDAGLRWGDTPLARHLSGPLLPSPDLRGPDARLTREGEAWVGGLSLPLAHERAAGTLGVAFRMEQEAEVELTVPALVLSHPDLAASELPPLALRATGRWSRDGAFEVEGRLYNLAFEGHGQLSADPLALDLTLDLGPAPLTEVVALFGPLIPEAEQAELAGELGLRLTLAGPPWRWQATASARGLGADGVVTSLDALRVGPFWWRPPAPEGAPVLRRTGEGTESWVPLDRAGRMAAAVVAAEDATFWDHHGYDLAAVQEALDTWAAGEERPRGGSTLTQQLAKNLFLDGERTLTRKLRELLFAVELDRRLGKARVLELYLNVVELGPGVYGVGPGADAYFLKRPEGLTWKEAAFLASILPAPRTYWEQVQRRGRAPEARMERVLDNLVRLGRLSAQEAARARAEPLRFVPPA